MSDSEARVVLMTAPDREQAAVWARTFVEERLAACVNLVPGLHSIYRWEGEVEEAQEVLLVAKTSEARCDALASRLEALHPYELPELVVLPVAGGSERYLAWVLAESTS